MCSLERQCIGNSLFTNRIFVSVVIIAFTIALPALFLAVVIPAYDRMLFLILFLAVIQHPPVIDLRKAYRRFCLAVNIIASSICMVIIDYSLAANLSSAAAIVQTAAIGAAVVVRHSAVLHIQNAFWKDFNAIILIFTSCEICTFFNRYITVPVIRAGVNAQAIFLILIQSYGCTRFNLTFRSQCCTAALVVARTERRSGINLQTVCKNAPTTAIIVISNKIGMIRNRHTAVITAKATAIACISTLRNINLRVIINQNVDWIDSHTVPVAVSDND